MPNACLVDDDVVPDGFQNTSLDQASRETGLTRPPDFAAHFRVKDGAWQSLGTHLREVAVLAGKFAGKLGLAELGELLGLLHDLGKYSQSFQTYLKSATGHLEQDIDDDWVDAEHLRGKIDHSTAGAQFVWRALSGGTREDQTMAHFLALCVASHHSGLINCLGADEASFGQDVFARRMNKADEDVHLAEVKTAADATVIERCQELLQSNDRSLALHDLIGKIARDNTGTSTTVICCQIGMVLRMLFSCLIDADRINSADFERPNDAASRPYGSYIKWQKLIDRLEEHLKGLVPRRPIDRHRNQISAHCLDAAVGAGGVYTLTVPTGGGKTLASLRFALHHAKLRELDRVIYVIPFTSIIDQNARDVRAILEPEDAPEDRGRVVLEHHGSLMPEQQNWREKVLCENWDAPVVYTTMVQFLEALFGAGTRGARRMHQLAKSVLVFDEVQTLPIRCVHLFNNAINFLVDQCQSTVVLCTATQPLLDHVSAERGAIRLKPGHEIMPDLRDVFDQLKRVDVQYRPKPGGWTYAEIAELALSETVRAGSCLVIVNTKDAAKQVFQCCMGRLDADSLVHLSTDMCPAHRKEVLGLRNEEGNHSVISRLARGMPVLCVSTQLIEAGVDVDFGAVIRAIAGLDSIAQAAGRCNRHGRPEMGVVHVVNPRDENLDRLPDIAVGRDKALRVLNTYRVDPSGYDDNVIGLRALREYYEYYFFERKAEMAYRLLAKDIGHDDDLLSLLALNQHADLAYRKRLGRRPELLLRQAFMTAGRVFKAIDAPTQALIVPYGSGGVKLVADLCAAYKLSAEPDLLRLAQQYTVNVFPHVLRKLSEAGALHPIEQDKVRIMCLRDRFYSPKFGLSSEPVSMMESYVQ